MAPKGAKNALVQYFCGATGAPQAVAQRYLQKYGNNLERATNAYLDESGNASGVALSNESRAALTALFDRYAGASRLTDHDEDMVTTDGALSMFGDLGIAPDSVTVLPLSYCLQSPSLGLFHREPYVTGWAMLIGNVKASSDEVLDQQREAIPRLQDAFARDEPLFGKGLYTSVYEYAFLFTRAEGQKSLPLEVATMLWDMLLPYASSWTTGGTFSEKQYAHWKRFLNEASGVKVITRDTWTQFLEFTHEKDAITTHDFEAAWPSLIDDYVAWARENTQ